jgi:hypothetical protein
MMFNDPSSNTPTVLRLGGSSLDSIRGHGLLARADEVIE